MKHVRHIGIDISDASVKVLSLDDEGNVFAYGHAPLPAGAVQEGRVVDGAAFAVGLRAVLAKTSPNILSDAAYTLRAVVSVPESKLFTHVFDIPADTAQDDIEQYVHDAAAQIIPVSLDELYTTVCVQENGGVVRANFAGAYMRDVELMVSGCMSAGVRPTVMCGEMFSLAQSLLPEALTEATAIIDLGARTTTVGIFNHNHIEEFSISIPLAGIFFSESVARILGISLAEAETKKRGYGLDPRYDATKVPGILRECVGEIIKSFNEARIFVEKNRGVRIARCILTGGSSHIPGIDALIAEHTGLTVVRGDATVRIKDHELFTKKEPAFLFANVIGLARMANAKVPPQMNVLTHYAWNTQTKRHSEVASEAWKHIALSLGKVERCIVRLTKRFHHEKNTFTIKTALTILFAVGAIGFLVWVILRYT